MSNLPPHIEFVDYLPEEGDLPLPYVDWSDDGFFWTPEELRDATCVALEWLEDGQGELGEYLLP